jgi:hypothetical protein
VGVLSRALAVATIASCYSPSVRDCVLPCGSAADCADGQGCSAERTCAAPAVTCNGDTPIDAPGMIAPHDATDDAADDAPSGTVPITVEINGTGSVQLMGSGAIGMQMCENDTGSNTSCTLALEPAKMAMAMAMAKGPDQFMNWSSLVCAGQMMSCTFTPLGPTTISVLFAKKP